MKIGFIGSGNMTSAIVSGMLESNFNANDIYCSDNNLEILQQKQQEFGINIASNEELVATCDIIFLAVKPQIISVVCTQIQPLITTQTIVSIAAGITTDFLSNALNTTRIIRAMPNTPATVGLGASGLFAREEQNETVDAIFNSFGISCWVNNELDIDSITALSGSGPAYFFLIFEAMIEASVKMGLDVHTAKTLCLQTAMGSAMMAAGDIDITKLRENVTSKGGTTQAALDSFASNNMKDIIEQAMQSAKKRAYELSRSL